MLFIDERIPWPPPLRVVVLETQPFIRPPIIFRWLSDDQPPWTHWIERDTTGGEVFRALIDMGFDINYFPSPFDPMLPEGQGTVWLTDKALMTLKLLCYG